MILRGRVVSHAERIYIRIVGGCIINMMYRMNNNTVRAVPSSMTYSRYGSMIASLSVSGHVSQTEPSLALNNERQRPTYRRRQCQHLPTETMPVFNRPRQRQHLTDGDIVSPHQQRQRQHLITETISEHLPTETTSTLPKGDRIGIYRRRNCQHLPTGTISALTDGDNVSNDRQRQCQQLTTETTPAPNDGDNVNTCRRRRHKRLPTETTSAFTDVDGISAYRRRHRRHLPTEIMSAIFML